MHKRDGLNEFSFRTLSDSRDGAACEERTSSDTKKSKAERVFPEIRSRIEESGTKKARTGNGGRTYSTFPDRQHH